MKKLLKTFSYKLYPNKRQEHLMRESVKATNFIYNLCLEQRNMWYRFNKKSISKYEQSKQVGQFRKEESWLQSLSSSMLRTPIFDLDRSFKSFFSRGHGFPKFRSRSVNRSFGYEDKTKFTVTEEFIRLERLGKVSIIYSRSIDGKPKTCTVTKKADGWYVNVACEVEMEIVPSTGPVVGIDIGINQPLTLSTGGIIDLPRVSKEEQKKLADLQRKLARQVKGSSNYNKTKQKVARFYQYLARRRKDAADKATTSIVKNYGTICIEDLKVQSMTASAKGTVEAPGSNIAQKSELNRSLLDIAPYQIRRMLEYKSLWNGCKLIAINPQYTSQKCSDCGIVDKENRKTQAEFKCIACGYIDNADINAAKNIKTAGQAELVCESNCVSGRKQKLRTKS